MHNDYTTLMSLVLDKEATPEQLAMLRQHVVDCGECASTWREWQALDVRIAAARTVAPPPDFIANLTARLAQRREERTRRYWLMSGFFLAWGGTLLAIWIALIGIAVWGYLHPLEVALLLATGAQVVRGLTWLLDWGSAVVFGLGQPSFALGLASFTCLTAGLFGIWLWAIGHSSRNGRTMVTVNES